MICIINETVGVTQPRVTQPRVTQKITRQTHNGGQYGEIPPAERSTPQAHQIRVVDGAQEHRDLCRQAHGGTVDGLEDAVLSGGA